MRTETSAHVAAVKSEAEARVQQARRQAQERLADERRAANQQADTERRISGGWGLHLVVTLADDWGADTRDHRTVVWFKLATDTHLRAEDGGCPAEAAR